MKKITLKSILKNTLQFALMLLVLSIALDWWRSPSAPLDAADRPLTVLSGSLKTDGADGVTTLAQQSSGRTLLLYFWGSWCAVCKHTSPTVQKLHADGVPVLGVAVRSGGDTDVRAYLHEHGWRFDTVNDADGGLSRQWQMKVTPTIVLVRDGRVVHTTTGLASYWGLKTRLWLAGFSGGGQ